MDIGIWLGAIFGIIIGALISGAVLWVVGKMKLGLTVESFGSAILAGLLIGLLTSISMALLGTPGGVFGAVINLVISAVVILFAGKALKGLTVDGFGGALLAAVAIAAIYWVLNLLAAGMLVAGTS